MVSGQTRAALAELTRSTLAAAIPSASVSVGRIEPYQPGADLPAIRIHVGQEMDVAQVSGQAGLATPTFARTFQLDIMAIATGASDSAVWVAIDTLVEAIRSALVGSTTWLQAAGGTPAGGSIAVESMSAAYREGDPDAADALAEAGMTLTVVVDGVQYGP